MGSRSGDREGEEFRFLPESLCVEKFLRGAGGSLAVRRRVGSVKRKGVCQPPGTESPRGFIPARVPLPARLLAFPFLGGGGPGSSRAQRGLEDFGDYP